MSFNKEFGDPARKGPVHSRVFPARKVVFSTPIFFDLVEGIFNSALSGIKGSNPHCLNKVSWIGTFQLTAVPKLNSCTLYAYGFSKHFHVAVFRLVLTAACDLAISNSLKM